MGKYLEGNYDSDNLAISNRQRMNDELEAWQIEREAQKYQETAKESEAKRILGEEQVSDAEIEKVFQEYAEEDKWRQYLVNGAVLTCNQATWEPFKVPGQENIVLEQNHIADKYTFPVGVLKVFDDEMVINGELYATVKDAVLGKNIFPFQCNCKKVVDRKDELTKIKKDPNCNKHGVCRHLMKLNEEWENLPLGKHLYKTKGAGINGEVENVKKEEIECITMTSMLFCKHGGLITPVTSGQENRREGELLIIYQVEAGAVVSGKSGESGKAAQAGEVVKFDFSSYESKNKFGSSTPNYYILNHEDAYIDENGLVRVSKISGCKNESDYYCVAMAPGFITAASKYCTPAEDGNINFGYKLQICLNDNKGNEYSMDVVVADQKYSKDENDFYPHNNLVEFIVDGNPQNDICEGGNVSFDKLLGGNNLKIVEVYAYEDGALITGNYRNGGQWEDR